MFKKKSLFIALLFILILLFTTLTTSAQESRVDVYEGKKLVKSVVFVVGLDEYFVNGQTPGVKMDAVPFIENGRTFVPIRYLGYALGVTSENVGWNEEEHKASLTLPPNTVEMTVSVKRIVTNSQSKIIDVAPILKSEPSWRTYLPARFVAEGLGYQVDWDEASGLVICWPRGEPRPDADIAKVKEFVGQKPPATTQVFTRPAKYGEWGAKSEEYRKQQEDIAVQYAKAARPFAGQPWDKSGWRFVDSLDFSGSWEIMKFSSINDLKPNGVNLGETDRSRGGVMVLLDLWVESDAIYIKAANAGGGEPVSPDMWLVEPGNLVRYSVGSPYSYLGNPFVHRYDLNWILWSDEGVPHKGWADGKVHHIDEFQGFLFEYGGDRVLYVPNPVHKGGK